ncbi:armadillo-type protein [Blyttiomyces helicus]|uniref:Armadillo-type protein n=1 Tax=Blyttiomyces helicus TaxID=388810 RepID=A0A4P9WNP8_9FUNG|nr:armadillo-type protein [Blyttiomyces helicus]|eukprot:RKO92386.1 armadillo-type protein [Blyttiomyces helicus]
MYHLRADPDVLSSSTFLSTPLANTHGRSRRWQGRRPGAVFSGRCPRFTTLFFSCCPAHPPLPKIKPFCVAALNDRAWTSQRRDPSNPFFALLTALRSIISSLDAQRGPIPLLLEYVLFPIQQLLSSDAVSEQSVEAALECVALMVGCCPPGSASAKLVEVFIRVMGNVISGGAAAGGVIAKPTEEVQAIAVRCLRELLRVCQLDGDAPSTNRLDLSQPRFLPLVGPIIVALLEIVEHKHNLDLRVQAVQTISVLVVRIRDPDLLAVPLPGVASTLAKILVRDEKDNHRIIVSCLDVLSDIVGRVMDDKQSEHLLDREEIGWAALAEKTKAAKAKAAAEVDAGGVAFEQRLAKHPATPAPSGPILGRDRAWLHATAGRLVGMLNVIFKIRDHSQWRVRLAFIRLASSLIQRCSRTLSQCVPTLVETLVFFVDDDFPAVATECRAQIDLASNRLTSSFSLSSILKANFDDLMMALPRALTQADDRKKLAALGLANGYLMLLKGTISSSLNASLDRISVGLLNVLTFDTSDIRLVEDRSAEGNLDTLEDPRAGGSGWTLTREGRSVAVAALPSFPRRRFLYFRDDRVARSISQTCRLLGLHGDVAVLADHFLERLLSPSALVDSQAQALYVLNEILLGAAGIGIRSADGSSPVLANPPARLHAVAKSVVREVLQCDFLHLPAGLADQELASYLLDPSEDSSPDLEMVIASRNSKSEQEARVSTYNATILKTSLVLETIATAARILPQPAFAPLLRQTLYPVLEALASPNQAVASSAAACLRIVAAGSGQPSESALVLANADYVIDAASRRIRHLALNPRAPRVLVAAVRVAGADIVGLLDDSVEEVLETLEDWYRGNAAIVGSLVEVLVAVLEAEGAGIARKAEEGTVGPKKAVAHTPAESIDEEESRQRRREEGLRAAGVDLPEECAGCSVEMLEFFLKERRSGDADAADEEFTADRKRARKRTMEEIGAFFKDASNPSQPPSNISENADTDAQPSPQPDVPPEPSMPHKILSRASNTLSAPHPAVRTLALRLVRAALPPLRHDRPNRDPTLATLWTSLGPRVADRVPAVAVEAWTTVSAVTAEAPDLCAGQRVLDIVAWFDAATAPLDTRPRPMVVVAACKAVEAILDSADVHIPGSALRRLVDAVVRVLSSPGGDRPACAARAVLAAARRRDPDAVWCAGWVGDGGAGAFVRPGLPPVRVPTWGKGRGWMGWAEDGVGGGGWVGAGTTLVR